MSVGTGIEWRAVPGIAGYSVSNDGHIRGPRGIMRPMSQCTGHKYIIARRKKLFVHQAVLFAFVGRRPIGLETRHLDGDPTNNRLGNLQWGTKTENMRDKQLHGTQPRGETAGTAKLTDSQVYEMRDLAGSMSYREMGRRFGVSHTAARRAVLGIKWNHLGAAA